LVNHHHHLNNDNATTSANSSNDDMLQYSNNLRRLTPKELLNLFGFPEDFDFPKDATLEHQYKLIGNSVNVTVVTVLIYELLFGGSSGGDNNDNTDD
jgi:tRNA (cytosine38-C5)-methyltransferase